MTRQISEFRPSAGLSIITSFSSQFDPTGTVAGPRIVQPVAHAIRPEVQNLQVYSYRYSVSDPSSPSKIHYISQTDKFIPYIRMNSHRSSKSLTESGRDRGGSASKRLETAAESQFVDRTCSCWARCARAAPLMLIDVRFVASGRLEALQICTTVRSSHASHYRASSLSCA